MINAQIQGIISLVIFISITAAIWIYFYKNYGKSSYISVKSGILLNLILPIIILVIVELTIPKIYVVSDYDKVEHYFMIYSSNFKLENGENVLVKFSGSNIIVNNTNRSLTLETLEYSSHPRVKNYDNFRVYIDPYSIKNTKPIDYFFRTPPNSISVKNQSQTKRIWLH